MTKEAQIKELVKEWLKKAKEDLITAQTLLDSPKERLEFLTSAIGFHSQQCVEKCLKSFLIHKQIDFRRSHDINYLLNLCKEETNKFEIVREDANFLNDYAVNTRYPGSYSSFSINESKKVVKLAHQVFELAETVATEMLEIENKDGFNLNH